jgi:hypothetical protein
VKAWPFSTNAAAAGAETNGRFYEATQAIMMNDHLSVIFCRQINATSIASTVLRMADDRKTHEQLSAVITKLLDFMEEGDIRFLTMHWQGGEIMTMPVDWFETAYELIDKLAAARGRHIHHGCKRT